MPIDTTKMLARLRTVLATARVGDGETDENIDTNAQKAAAKLSAKRLEPSLSAIISILSACKTPGSVQDLLTAQNLVVERSRSVGMSHRKQPALFKIHARNLQRLADLLGAAVCYHAYHAMIVSDGTPLDVWKEYQLGSHGNGLRINATFKDWIDDPDSTPRMPKWQGEPHQFLASTGEEIRAIKNSKKEIEGFETVARKLMDTSKDAREWQAMHRSNVGGNQAAPGGSASFADDDVVGSAYNAKSWSSDADSHTQAVPDAAVRQRIRLVERQAALDIETAEFGKEAAARLHSQNQIQAQGQAKKTRHQKTENTNGTPKSTKTRAAKKQASMSTPVKKLETFKVMSGRQVRDYDLTQDSSALGAAKKGSDERQTELPAQPFESAQPNPRKAAKKSLLVTLRISPAKLARLEEALLAKSSQTSPSKQISSTPHHPEQASRTATVASDAGQDTTSTRADGREKIILKLGRKRASAPEEMPKPWDRVPEVWPESAIRTHADTAGGDVTSEKRPRSVADNDHDKEAAAATKKARLE
ncbi:hypothetical protein LTR17_014513 [Elasticomyces elasticus]|nr:hypothetical protein LTR17_014513 [Elasticomyces elasticus]